MVIEKAFDRRCSPIVACAAAILLVAVLPSSALVRTSYAQQATNPLAGTTFPPPITRPLSAEPSYVINIYEENGKTVFVPDKASIPAGMTVIWFNNGIGDHSVTTLKNKSYSPPEDVGSGVILGRHSSVGDQFAGRFGGSFIHTFTKPGIYNYTDSRFPLAKGVIEVGNAVEKGNHFDMNVGGMNSLPFDPKMNNSVVLRFTPKDTPIPPTTSITYNVTIAGPDKNQVLTTQQYSDRDGILDLELISSPSSQMNATAPNAGGGFTTWGPDFTGQTGYTNTGTFHIKGPLMNQNGQYFVTITMISKDNQAPKGNISDTFTLMPKP